jgi:hypothetical protein
MSETKSAPTVQTEEGGKAKSSFFAAVRERGMNNALLDEPAQSYMKNHPEMRAKWEYCPPNGDNSLVIAREMQGFKLIDASEIPGTASSQKTGVVRRGDLVLMAAPSDIYDLIQETDAKAALEDLRLPETSYRDALESNKVQTSAGPDYARPTGQITRTVEVVQPKVTE